MKTLFSRLSVRARLWSLVAASLLVMAVSSTVGVSGRHQQLLDERMLKTRHVVETAHGVLAHFHTLESAGQLSREDAQAAAAASVKSLRYEQNDYFWINDMQARMVMHPIKPKLDGKPLADFEDPSGKRLFSEFVRVVKSDGAGFVPYLWPKPGQEDPVPKVSYVKGFKPWGWVIGTGIYLDDVNAAFRADAGRAAGGLLVAALVFVAIATVLARSITGPILQASRAMRDIAEGDGDLTRRVDARGRDEVSELCASFNAFADRVHGMVSQLAETTDRVAAGTAQLSTVTETASETLSRQTGETEQVATSMTEMANTVQEVARNAQEAAGAAQKSDAEAKRGQQVVEENMEAIRTLAGEVERAAEVIHRLEKNTEGIGSILDVIRGVADQTNLLALNAAIEAARAGEQGRGFAVVADEVRTLASRTQESTREIQEMIERVQSGAHEAVQVMEESRGRAEQGVQRASAVGESLETITGTVATISTMNDQIASAAEEQSVAAEDINRNVVNIRQYSEQARDDARGTAEAGRELAELARELRTMVGHFRI